MEEKLQEEIKKEDEIETNEVYESKDDLKKKIAKATIATITAGSVLVGGTFDTPKDIINDQYKQPAVVTEIHDDLDEDSLENDSKDKSLVKDKLKRLIYKIPVKIRAVLFVPMWFIGSFILNILAAIVKFVGLPLLTFLGSVLMHFVIMFIVIAICLKILFPNIPLRKLLNKKVFIGLILGSVILSLCDLICPMFIENYTYYRLLSKIIIGLIVITILMIPFIKKKFKDINQLEVRYE